MARYTVRMTGARTPECFVSPTTPTMVVVIGLLAGAEIHHMTERSLRAAEVVLCKAHIHDGDILFAERCRHR